MQLLDEADGILNTATRECRDISSRFVVRMYIARFSWLYLIFVWQKFGCAF
jgi:hypothetical protein